MTRPSRPIPRAPSIVELAFGVFRHFFGLSLGLALLAAQAPGLYFSKAECPAAGKVTVLAGGLWHGFDNGLKWTFGVSPFCVPLQNVVKVRQPGGAVPT